MIKAAWQWFSKTQVWRAWQRYGNCRGNRLAGATTDLLRNVRAVQAFGRIDRAAAIFGTRNRAVLDVERET